jgi:transcriptional regulator with XRE-family HTH domain
MLGEGVAVRRKIGRTNTRPPIDTIYAIIGRRLRRARERAGLNQTELGEIVGVPSNYISGMECGTRRYKLEVLYLAATALDVEPRRLLPTCKEAGIK